MGNAIYEEYGMEGVVFILVTLICLFLLKLDSLYSILVGAGGSLITYLIKRGRISK